MEPTVLIAHDGEAVVDRVRRAARRLGAATIVARGDGEALEAVRAGSCEVVVVADAARDGGSTLLRRVRALDPDAAVIATTSSLSEETALAALEAGAFDVLVTPLGGVALVASQLARAIERVRLVRHNRELLEHLDRSTEQLDRINTALVDLAGRDGLTGLHTARHLREVAETEVGRARRHGRMLSVIAIDVDDFTRFNQLHGRLAGDALLRALARLLQQRSRTSTVVARDEGGAFMLLAPETPPDGATRYAAALREIVAGERFVGGESQPAGRVTVGVGVASFPADGTDAAALLERARQRVRLAKRAGRDRVVAVGDAGGARPVA